MTIGVPLRRQQTLKGVSAPMWLFLLFWVMKPFYFRASGSVQVSDMIFALSFGAWVAQNGWRVVADRRDRYFFLFVFSVFLINLAYYIAYRQTEFLMSSLYFLYNLFVVLEVRDLSRSRKFLSLLMLASGVNLAVQLLVYRFHLGTYLYENLRYMGTFNDPNQYSFSMFTSFLLIYLLFSYHKDQTGSRGKLWPALALALAAYFTNLGSSAGMLVGLAAFGGLVPLLYLYSERTRPVLLLRYLAFALLALAVLYLVTYGFSVKWISAVFGEDNFFTVRLAEKLWHVNTGGSMAFFSDRGLDKVLENPLYLLYGAGDGLYARFPNSAYEVHSTLPALLFCYGLVPFLFLCRWIWDNLKHMSLTLVPLYAALLVESFTLAHQRQPVFWMLILLGSLAFRDRGLRKYRIVTEL